MLHQDDPKPLLPPALDEEVLQALQRLPIDPKGHNLGQVSKSQKYMGPFWSWTDSLSSFDQGKAEAFLAAYKAKIPLSDPIPLLNRAWSEMNCIYCHQGRSYFTDGLQVWAEHQCPNPHGMNTTFTINFPSGKVLVSEDLRDLCPIRFRYCESFADLEDQMLEYSRNNLALGYGYKLDVLHPFRISRQSKDGKYTIGLRNGGKKLCQLSSGFVAYSLMDFDEAMRRGKLLGLDPMELPGTIQVISLPPGEYRFRHHFHVRDNLRITKGTKLLLADFEKVSP